MSLADRLSDCDAVIHAGDIGRQKVLDDIRSLVPNTPVYPVLGNCDVMEQVSFDEEVPDSNVLLFDDVAFVVAHEPESAAFSLSEFLSSPVYSILGDVVAVHGHTPPPTSTQAASTTASYGCAPAPCRIPETTGSEPSPKWTWKGREYSGYPSRR